MASRRFKFVLFASLATAVIMAAAAAGPLMSKVEQPDYKVELSEGAFEIRLYDKMIAAQAQVEGERKAAIGEGFRLIAAYIFGANKSSNKIEMTAPVQQQRQQTIAMTAPVTQQFGNGNWTVRFIMPKKWTIETLPVPDDSRVTLIPLPAKRAIAIRFSGTASDSTIQNKTSDLREFAERHHIKTSGEPVLAFYNPPWTLPFLRRNEIMLDVAASADAS
ncbi:MAG: heme-binding protein [Bradyrhizobiaceae bacterium]|nr:MAG: heme-binding protein [Bradyrhizobiaceae bacterium]